MPLPLAAGVPTWCGMSEASPSPLFATLLPAPLARPLKRAIVAEVRGLFNDAARGERPVARREDGWFGPGSVAWRLHGDVAAMMVGGMAGLLLQMLHPAVLAGVWDHSDFRADMSGRLRRTARFIALTTYGGPEEAAAVAARVRGIHARVRGVLPDGTPYAADDPALLAWVHVTEVVSFLEAGMRYAAPDLSAAEQDRYVAEMARVGEALGAAPVPRSPGEAQRLIEAMRPGLRCDGRTREVAGLVLSPGTGKAEPLRALAGRAAVDLLPLWARRMHGLEVPLLAAPLVRGGVRGVARTLRWAFA
ncbi:oxygenase MpaB family protein [Roseomonas mucosa]